MPTGYAGEGRHWSQKQGRWLKKEKEKTFDYDELKNKDSAALILSFFRYYPDYLLDLLRSDEAKYKLELPQRMLLRIFARYRNVYCTGCRGLTKTYVLMLSKETDGTLYPGEKIRYCAPSQKQSAKLASDAFKTTEHEYPILASWWLKNNDRGDMFRITTTYGSEFTMYAPRGDNCSSVVGEEMGQEGEEGFDMETFEKDVSPTCRLPRKIHGLNDRCHINLKETYIANACSRQNKAYTVYRAGALKDMLYGDEFDGMAIDIPWEVALLCNLRDIEYYKKEKKHLTPENWQREMCVKYIGNDESPMVQDEKLSAAKKIQVAEFEHCKDDNAIYVVSHDVSYKDSRKSAKCADVVVKLTPYEDKTRRDKYRKQVVFVDNYPPAATDYLQARKLKELWAKFCMNGGNTTYLVVDTQAYGTSVVEELMKPSDDGLPTLCCVEHIGFTEIEAKGALPVIYPLKAGTRGVRDEEGLMITYAQAEFEHGNVELLTGNVLDGVEAYKNMHNIKDNYTDGRIAVPYKQTELLCQQIANLRTKVSGMTLKEERKSPSIQRDIWSALKYALRMAQILESDLVKETYAQQSTWTDYIKANSGENYTSNVSARVSTVNNLLKMRHR